MGLKKQQGKTVQFDYTALDCVISNQAVADALLAIVEKDDRQAVFLAASASLSAATGEFADIQNALGGRFAGFFTGVGSHTPRKDVMKVLAAAREAEADVLVSLGGGSIIDACKTVQLAMDQDIHSEQQLLEYAQLADGTRGPKYADYSLLSANSAVRQIAVPTTLSGGEFSNNAGVLNSETSAKEGYRGINLCPKSIIYDPQLSVHTPEWLWLSTAIRSLDHAVEGYCSADSHPFLDGHFLHAMTLFSRSLPVTKKKPNDLAARNLSQQAVWLACCGLGTVAHGASHGIGYILGSLCAVPHGFTSCVMLPAVLEWNSQTESENQQGIAAALGQENATAAEAVASLIAGLELPRSLRDVGVSSDQLDEIAKRAIRHPVVRRNPRELHSADQIMEILEIAW
jgi:maleylacetate reductase